MNELKTALLRLLSFRVCFVHVVIDVKSIAEVKDILFLDFLRLASLGFLFLRILNYRRKLSLSIDSVFKGLS
jgi:hypothetical protein